jgi:p-aminobenzoyl-glutamate transporter AbgT
MLNELVPWIGEVGQTLPHPLLLMAMLALTTLLVEDAALAAGVALAGAGGL